MELRQILSVLVVFALLGGALFALRRGSLGSLASGAIRWRSPGWSSALFTRAPARTKSLAAMERLALTPHHALHLVRIQGREVVVATHPRGCTVLSEGRVVPNADRASMNDGCAVLNNLPGGLRP